MSRIVILCYEKLEEIFDDFDNIEKHAKEKPSMFQQELSKFQGLCNLKRRGTSTKSSGEATRKARDLSAKLIKEYGIYGALDKIAILKELLSTCPGLYLNVALGVIEIEIEEVLETSLRMKYPKLLKLSKNGQTKEMIELINSEENMDYLLGIEPVEEPTEQIALFEIEAPKKRKFRYDQYLRIKRKMGIEGFLHETAHKLFGLESFSVLAGDMIVAITENQEICSQIHPSIPKKLMKITTLAFEDTENDNATSTNPDQISINDLPKVYSYQYNKNNK